MSSGGRATSSSCGHCPRSSAGRVTFGSTNVTEGLASSQSPAGGRGTFRSPSSGSYQGSTGYLGSSTVQENFRGTEGRGAGSQLSGGLESIRGRVSSAGIASSINLGSATSKDTQGYR
ncbi:hypothetical protein MC885_017344 [Smutsia gigantea]|nr:hypothetical protein MC885_017344 [Smutsia gigantea]